MGGPRTLVETMKVGYDLNSPPGDGKEKGSVARILTSVLYRTILGPVTNCIDSILPVCC